MSKKILKGKIINDKSNKKRCGKTFNSVKPKKLI